MADQPEGLLQLLAAQAAATGPLEAAAVLLGFGYIGLAIRQHRSCWLAGGFSTALYVIVFLDARLYLQSALQVAYVVLAVYGWREWGRDAASDDGMSVRHWSLDRHFGAFAGVGMATLATAPALAAWSDSAAPWADAFGTWASIAATWMLVRKVPANWIWWMVVDSWLAWLFATQGLAFTSLLYVAFALLATVGWWTWRRASRAA